MVVIAAESQPAEAVAAHVSSKRYDIQVLFSADHCRTETKAALHQGNSSLHKLTCVRLDFSDRPSDRIHVGPST